MQQQSDTNTIQPKQNPVQTHKENDYMYQKFLKQKMEKKL